MATCGVQEGFTKPQVAKLKALWNWVYFRKKIHERIQEMVTVFFLRELPWAWMFAYAKAWLKIGCEISQTLHKEKRELPASKAGRLALTSSKKEFQVVNLGLRLVNITRRPVFFQKMNWWVSARETTVKTIWWWLVVIRHRYFISSLKISFYWKPTIFCRLAQVIYRLQPAFGWQMLTHWIPGPYLVTVQTIASKSLKSLHDRQYQRPSDC